MLIEDLRKASFSKTGAIKVLFFSPAFHSIIIFRASSFFYKNIPIFGNFFSIILEYINRIIYSVDISRKAIIGSGFVIQHGIGLVIGSKVVIGNNCRIFNGVNLGNKYVGTGINLQPKIGDNVIIGAGAKCLGGIVIGDNVVIGANSVVLKSIPNYSTCVGIPAKIIKN